MGGFEVGLATPESTVFLHWQPGGRDYAPFEALLASDAPKVCWDAKQQMGLVAKAGLELRGVNGDAALAAWLLRPTSPDKTLADATFRFLGEQMPEGDPNQLIPEEGSVAGPEVQAWYLVRSNSEAERRFEGGTASVYTDIELPLTPVLHALEQRGVQILSLIHI